MGQTGYKVRRSCYANGLLNANSLGKNKMVDEFFHLVLMQIYSVLFLYTDLGRNIYILEQYFTLQKLFNSNFELMDLKRKKFLFEVMINNYKKVLIPWIRTNERRMFLCLNNWLSTRTNNISQLKVYSRHLYFLITRIDTFRKYSISNLTLHIFIINILIIHIKL